MPLTIARTLILGFGASVLLGVPVSGGQRQLGAIHGTVLDQTGAVMTGVIVTVSNKETKEKRTSVTNAIGIYRIVSLDPGDYSIIPSLSGFVAVERPEVLLSVGATLRVNLTMVPATFAEEVRVIAAAPDIQTERAELSSVVNRQRLLDLPVAGRNPLQLVTLQAGIIGLPGGTDALAQEQSLSFNAAGQRVGANSALVDGLSVNSSPWNGTVLMVPNAEAVQEFRVVTSNPSAEFGRNSGAVISLVTRGGTNELRGTAFWFHRNNDLRARTFFEARKEDLNRHELGVIVGGPIQRDTTFFFFSFDYVTERSGSSQQFTVETEQFREYVKRTRPNSHAAYLLDTFRPPSYPFENLRDLGSPTPGVRVIGPPDGVPDVGTINHTVPRARDGYQVNGRLDRVFGGGDKLRASYYVTSITPEFPHLRSAFTHPFPHRTHFLAVSHMQTLSSHSVNELSFGYLRMHGEVRDPTPESPTINIAGLSGQFGVEFWHPMTFTQSSLELRNALTMSRGRHNVRFGGELRLSLDDSELHHWERPNYTFSAPPGVAGSSGILDFADDEPSLERRAVDPRTGLTTFAPADYRSREFALFVQDDWTLRRNVTLNVGVRYEVFMQPKKVGGMFNAIVVGSGTTRQEQVQNARITTAHKLFGTDWNNIGPRLGVTWSPDGHASTVIRAAAGLSYNRINLTAWDDRLNPPQFANAVADVRDNVPIVYGLGPIYAPNPALGRGLDDRGGIRGARVDLQVIAPDTTVPYSYNWFVGVQRQLPWAVVFEANYIGTAGRKLMSFDVPNGEDYNRFAGDMADGVRNRLNPSFGAIKLQESRIASNYHGFTMQANRRFSRSLGFQVAYTWGTAKDHPGSAEEVTNLQRDYGPAAFDVRHNLTLNAIWQIPYRGSNRWLSNTIGDWQVNAVIVRRSGTPFTVTCGNCDFNQDGVEGDRVNLPAFGNTLPSFTREQWTAGGLVAADFPRPVVGHLGTLPRNAYYGPGYFTSDISIIKNVAAKMLGARSQTIQLRVEAYNVFNTVNLANPNANVANVNFGRVTALRTPGDLPGSRLIQLAVKVLF